MLYIFNKTIDDSKSILYGLTQIYGINLYKSKKICNYLGINPQISINKLKKNQVNKIIKYINKYIKIEELLKKNKKENINNLLNIKNIRGIRLNNGLPVNGQRTHTNAKTVKKFNFKKSININNLKKKNVIKKKKKSKKK